MARVMRMVNALRLGDASRDVTFANRIVNRGGRGPGNLG